MNISRRLRTSRFPARLLPGLLAIMLLLAACGSDGGDTPAAAPDDDGGAAEPEPEPEPEADDPEPTEEATEPEEELEPLPITVGFTAYSVLALPMWIAEDFGLFEEYGLDAQVVYLEGGASAVQGLLSGDVGVTIAPPDTVGNARLQGADVSVIAECADKHLWGIYGQPDLTSIEDLRGKVLGASSPGALSEELIVAVMAEQGMVEGDDYSLAFVGGTAGRVAALETGSVDAAIISHPQGLIAEEAGFPEIIDLLEMNLPISACGLNVRDSWAEDNGEAVKRFLQAWMAGLKFATDNQDEAIETLSSWMDVDDQEILEFTYDLGIQAMTQVPHPPSLDVIQGIIDKSEAAGAADADPADFVQPAFMQELEDSGFTAELWN